MAFVVDNHGDVTGDVQVAPCPGGDAECARHLLADGQLQIEARPVRPVRQLILLRNRRLALDPCHDGPSRLGFPADNPDAPGHVSHPTECPFRGSLRQ
jgi:hypothetical protein